MVTSAAMPPASPPGEATGAGDPLLASKITVPGMPGWLVPRPRVEKLMAQGARGPVTTVTGPPGAGKTMALALWAAGRSPAGPVAWVTIDDYDNRPRVFWSYVLAALQRAGVPIPKGLSATARRYAVDHDFLLRFVSLIAAQDPPVTLVLDDVHLLTAPKVLDGLAYVRRHGGSGLRLVVASRMDPLLPLHRYRLTGELTEIRAGDLAFTVPEARQLMAQHGIALSAESLERLTRRAEGWAAIMRLAAMSMDGHPDPDQFVKELIAEDSAVAGFLVEEVLNAQPVHVRDFLLRTSILDRVNEHTAGALVDDSRYPAVLPELARTNPLVQRDYGGWYRYHSLFAAVLRLKLRREHPGEMPGLHLRAARWYRRHGMFAEAVRHAGDAGDWPFAARAVVDELVIDRLIDPRGSESLAGGFRPMPRDREWMEPQPWLVAAAIDFARGQDAASEASLDAAERMLGRLPAGDEIASRLAAALIRLALARRSGDLDAAAIAVAAAQVLIEALPDDQLARHPGIEAHVLAGRGAIELWSGRFDEASALFEAGAAAERAPERERERADCLGHLALIEILRGRLSRAADLAAEATGAPGGDIDQSAGPMSQAAEVALASVYLERNELPRARRWLKRALDALRARPDRLIGSAACLVAARHSLAEGRGQAALHIVDRAWRGWSPPAWIETRLMVLRSQAYAAMADFQSAIDTATQAGPQSSLDATVTLARALLATGDAQAARHALPSAPPAPSGPRTPDRFLLSAWLLDAHLSYGSGDPRHGRRSLERALRLAEPEQLRLPFAMERSWLRPVLRRDPELAHPYRRLLEPDLLSPDLAGPRPASPGQAGAGAPGAGPAAPMVVEPLSEREREVLRHVSAMESTAEIASEMYISVNTVKTHLKSIYRKLAVSHRGEAVRRARQFGLL
jgi:LuxR family transcriptional regulator, maltose regulon positive regulatory protein